MPVVSAMKRISTVAEMVAQAVCNEGRSQNIPQNRQQLLLCQQLALMFDKCTCAESKGVRVITARQKTGLVDR